MPKGILFWVLMVLWFFVGAYWYYAYHFGGVPDLLLFVLLFLLGWKVFGFVVQ